MVKAFKEKLGEGGYGSVFKGKLSSGTCVAIKMMDKSKGNGHDFISEVATIGRIHHQNVVQLIGFCVEGSRRALVYEFMSNGSLDRIIFSKDRSIDFDYNKIYHISIGIARGIAYLHHGCEMQILHFDIKPHNILLDDNFIPKVSDFGLARLFPVDNSIDTMTAFWDAFDGNGKQKEKLKFPSEHSSQIFFPSWVYENIREEKDIEMEDITEEEKKIAKKMILLNPNDRPSMNKVVEMLEEKMENLEIPPNFSLYPYEASSVQILHNSAEFCKGSRSEKEDPSHDRPVVCVTLGHKWLSHLGLASRNRSVQYSRPALLSDTGSSWSIVFTPVLFSVFTVLVIEGLFLLMTVRSGTDGQRRKRVDSLPDRSVWYYWTKRYRVLGPKSSRSHITLGHIRILVLDAFGHVLFPVKYCSWSSTDLGPVSLGQRRLALLMTVRSDKDSRS
ncbi:hypothetical protein V8G54_037427 [Vigna mungo]|uniref:non-specific serine/threonine protein kinase n=1 Tax=Vigna mungo TaxID=3915 RepID=A0AAQ3MJJ8_VIGMU